MKKIALQIALGIYAFVATVGGGLVGLFSSTGIAVAHFGSQVLSANGDGWLNESHPAFMWIVIFMAPGMVISMVGSAVTFVLPVALLYPTHFFTKETRRIVSVRMLERRLKIISIVMDGDDGKSQMERLGSPE